MGRQHLFFFCYAILGKQRLGLEPLVGPLARRGTLCSRGPEVDFSFHMEMCRFLDEEAWGAQLTHIEAPRDHFKTTIITVGRTLQLLARDPNTTFLLAGATMDRQAAPFLEACKYEIETNELLRGLYPHLRKGNPWSAKRFRVSGQKGVREASVSAVGEGGSAASGHFGEIILDDLALEENTLTRARADKTNNWTTMLMPMVNAGGHILLYGTRYKDYDVHGFWEREMPGQFLRRSWSALYDDEGNPTLDVDGGNILFPEEWSRERLRERMESMGVLNFSAQYLNDPIPAELAVMKPEWIDLAWEEKAELPTVMTKYIGMDPSLGDGKDKCAIYVVGVDKEDNIHVLRRHVGRWTFAAQSDMFLTVLLEEEPAASIIESMGIGAAIEQLVQEKMEQRGVMSYVEYPRWQVNKEARIQAILQPLLESGRLKILDHLKGSTLVEEMVRFPKGTYDDEIDALTMACDCAIRYGYMGHEKVHTIVRDPLEDPVFLRKIREGQINLSMEEIDSGLLHKAIFAGDSDPGARRVGW